MRRRSFLMLAGGGVLFAAVAGAAGFAATRTPTGALAPWHAAGDYEDPLWRALSYAILAPNPHNRQPWIADLREVGQVTLRVDTSRMLPHTDPFNRQITIGLGCFLELLAMAAAEQGYRAEIDLFPDGTDSRRLTEARIAVVRLVSDASIRSDPLFAEVLRRRSNKRPFDTRREVPEAALAAITAAARHQGRVAASRSQDSVERLRRITSEALRIEIETPHTYRESIDLFRIGKREVEADPDGIAFSGVLFETLALAGQLDRQRLMDTTSSAFRQGLETVLAATESAMAHTWLVTPGNSREEQIEAGRDWVRMNLAATAAGIGFHPLSQPLQEYPEMSAHYREVHGLLAPDGGTVQMLCRLGYGPRAAPSPRWPLERKVLQAT